MERLAGLPLLGSIRCSGIYFEGDCEHEDVDYTCQERLSGLDLLSSEGTQSKTQRRKQH